MKFTKDQNAASGTAVQTDSVFTELSKIPSKDDSTEVAFGITQYFKEE